MNLNWSVQFGQMRYRSFKNNHSLILTKTKSILEMLDTVKPRKQEHSKIRTCRLILWKKTPKDKNQKQTDLLQCSYEMVHLVDKFHHISVNKLPTIHN